MSDPATEPQTAIDPATAAAQAAVTVAANAAVTVSAAATEAAADAASHNLLDTLSGDRKWQVVRFALFFAFGCVLFALWQGCIAANHLDLDEGKLASIQSLAVRTALLSEAPPGQYGGKLAAAGAPDALDTGNSLHLVDNGDTQRSFITLANMQTNLQHIRNQQAILLASFAIAVALLAIGFVLFVLGIDGAFRLTASGKADASLVLSASAPGILCFALATIIVGIALTRQSTIDPSTVPLSGGSPKPVSAPQGSGAAGGTGQQGTQKAAGAPATTPNPAASGQGNVTLPETAGQAAATCAILKQQTPAEDLPPVCTAAPAGAPLLSGTPPPAH